MSSPIFTQNPVLFVQPKRKQPSSFFAVESAGLLKTLTILFNLLLLKALKHCARPIWVVLLLTLDQTISAILNGIWISHVLVGKRVVEIARLAAPRRYEEEDLGHFVFSEFVSASLLSRITVLFSVTTSTCCGLTNQTGAQPESGSSESMIASKSSQGVI
jgi:hypothetical protein